MVSCKKGALKKFAKFTGKHLCWSFVCSKVAWWRLAALLKTILRQRDFPWILEYFLECLFRRGSVNGWEHQWIKKINFTLFCEIVIIHRKISKVTNAFQPIFVKHFRTLILLNTCHYRAPGKVIPFWYFRSVFRT